MPNVRVTPTKHVITLNLQSKVVENIHVREKLGWLTRFLGNLPVQLHHRLLIFLRIIYRTKHSNRAIIKDRVFTKG